MSLWQIILSFIIGIAGSLTVFFLGPWMKNSWIRGRMLKKGKIRSELDDFERRLRGDKHYQLYSMQWVVGDLHFYWKTIIAIILLVVLMAIFTVCSAVYLDKIPWPFIYAFFTIIELLLFMAASYVSRLMSMNHLKLMVLKKVIEEEKDNAMASSTPEGSSAPHDA